jgi:hypothetical protein
MNRRLFKDTLLQADLKALSLAFTTFHWRMTAVILLITAVGHLLCGSVAAGDQMASRKPGRRPVCLSSIVPLNRSWEEERNANINQEFNDYAAIYLDSFSTDCKAAAATTLAQKLEGTLRFADGGGTVKTMAGLEVHPFHNWLWGAAITHVSPQPWNSATTERH